MATGEFLNHVQGKSGISPAGQDDYGRPPLTFLGLAAPLAGQSWPKQMYG
ncbi:hypothetical protein [Mesorhizobium sp. M0011]